MKTKTFFLFILVTVLSVNLMAQKKDQLNLDNGFAISGYDPVAYFTVNKAVKGKKDLIVNEGGVYYLFSTAANKEEFKKNPAKYEPQYGGWCAYAMGAKGSKVEVDPETFKIIDGKLFLFYHSTFNNTLTSWNKDESNLKSKADVNWNKITH